MTVGSTARRSPGSRVLVPLIAAVLGALLTACTPPGGESEPTPTPSPTPSASTAPSPEPSGEQSTGGSATPTGQFFRGLPPGVESVPGSAGQAGAGWSDAERQLFVVTFGSSTCPLVGVGVTGSEEGLLTVELVETGGDICTTDIVPTTSVVEVPGSVSRDDGIVVVLGDLGEVSLPAWDGATVMAWLPNA
ncbi:hypothetical protein Bcav_0685 [Beutenbergia cavernae DSM 12333]|uniref:Uncharacterized protein n=1 Tax=Beutenbergia cavernae (strain ATCC BAA-8 / DSM 12333 / CCUG 43141 / JCM 11478 / NBRC 16432 / NCIMB 13614 / HKI 0122) TaxID=471853 RepID=C5BYI8_BEUC1|nr:hypothetical protein [Beutenbergia cavernae]ACQ78946.1 hypothetical protein Bcav_0685 [Beutenbergia cavernae DSM 12333]